MTEFLIRTVSRYPLRRLARPSAVLVFALALAYGGGFWQTFLHSISGAREANEPGLMVHWLRDATLSLPLVFAAVWVGVLVARRLIERNHGERSPVISAAVLAATVAWVTSIVLGLASPLHNGLFGGHHGPDTFYLVHAGRDALLGLAVNLPLAAIVSAAMLRTKPWAAPLVDAWRRPRTSGQRLALQGALALVIVAPVAIFAQSGAQVATAGSSPGTPCPAGAPVKTFDIAAIDVDITLNRFGDHDPSGKMYVGVVHDAGDPGKLDAKIAKVREAESSRYVSLGLKENDPIQSLVIRANLGDCVDINFTNKASGGDYGVHIDGLAYDVDSSSGDAIGRNASSAAGNGETRHYRYWVPRDPQMEGAHYLRPGPGHRSQVAHGLFGALTVEPAGSKYLDMTTGEPVETGWQATIVPADGRKAFREYNLLHHEIGTEKESVFTRTGGTLPRVDPHTEAYRPGTRAMNYRSEPFMNRLDQAPSEDAHGYGSYTFGDPATPMPRGYQGDPTKIRILHAGSEVFHVYHLHGGSIRWRLNPHADSSYSYEATGLDKSPKVQDAKSSRLDSQAFGPGESYDLEIEGGAGGLQQGAGEFLFHCHIAKHYVGGMWSFWRVFDTLQPDLKPLPDRTPLPAPVSSAELVKLYAPGSGRTLADGSSLTSDNVDAWIRPQLPPQGKRLNDQDATVWDWDVQASPDGPVYLGEPADKSSWADYTTPQDRDRVDGHPSLMPGDKVAGAEDRPHILFNPANGRPAFPLLRPHLAKRPPFAPNAHSGAPYLGENADQAKSTPAGVPDPWAGRKDGICPASTPQPARTFNIVGIDVKTPVTKTATDPKGKVFVLAKKKAAVLADPKLVEPLAIRANIGDCVAVTLTSEMSDLNSFSGFSKINMHIHHVQFDTQASDGVISGMSYEQSIRPYKAEDVQLETAVSAGQKTLKLINRDGTRPERLQKLRPGVGIAVGQGTDDIEVRIIDTAAADGTITLTQPLSKDHAADQWAGTEFVQSRWYPDVALDNIFWHDHVDGIHTWGQGLVGQLIIEPKGSTYHDPNTGEQVDSGTYVDIHTTNPVAKGLVEGAFRELALWQIDDNPITDSTLNLRAEPWADRLTKNPDPSLLFSSFTHGDPHTQLPQAYLGDPFVVRTINVGPSLDSLHFDGHRFFYENRYLGPDGKVKSTPTDTLHYGVSERYTAILDGGAGGIQQQAGDYMYMNAVGRRFRQGAWGLLRVLPQKVNGLQQLPDRVGKIPGDGSFTLPAATGGRPGAAAADGGDPCAAAAPVRSINVSAVDVPGVVPGRTAAFVPSDIADQVKSGAVTPEPLVAHVAAGECLTVTFHNQRATDRASFHVNELTKSIDSSGVNVGFNPEQTVAPGGQRTYRFYADTRKVGSAAISDYGGNDSGTDGLYGAVVVAPAHATFTDPEKGTPVQFGASVDVHVPGSPGYRDFTAIMADDDPIIGGNFMPYPDAVAGPALINYRNEVRPDDANAFNSKVYGDPATPMFRAYGGDPAKVHFMVAPGSEQGHVFNLGGHHWLFDPEVSQSQLVQNQGLAPNESFDAELEGGAGGLMRSVGDYYYGDMRRPFTQAGMWGLMRVMSDPSCPIKPLGGLSCTAQPSIIFDPPENPVRPGEPAPGDFLGGGGEITSPPVLAAAAAPAPTVAGAVNRPTTAPRGLRVRGRVSLREFLTRGLRMELLTPRDTRVLDIRLTRVRGKRLVPAAKGVVLIKRGGPITLRWKPGRKVVSTLRSGTYVLRVRVGPNAKGLSRQADEITVRLTGRATRR
jgi:FtsP/CotA-like multicopper oxidase with cupredoxin domain